jgi:hypothetical protein
MTFRTILRAVPSISVSAAIMQSHSLPSRSCGYILGLLLPTAANAPILGQIAVTAASDFPGVPQGPQSTTTVVLRVAESDEKGA